MSCELASGGVPALKASNTLTLTPGKGLSGGAPQGPAFGSVPVTPCAHDLEQDIEPTLDI